MNEAILMASWWRGVERAAIKAWLNGTGTIEEWKLAADQVCQWSKLARRDEQ